ncbi:MAG: hypothetical protein LBU86_05265 [Oscillospiraceae bacterium]|jgi:hypothetical protein|nr:hypothetical protein [Oscillospiraceae bacterium]
MKRLSQAAVALLLLFIPAFFLRLTARDGYKLPPERSILDGGALGELSNHIRENLPFKERLREMSLSVRAFGGQREYNGIFINGDELIPNLDPPTTDSITRENQEAILTFSEEMEIATFCMILPTASAIRQERLPPFSRSRLFNQKQYIEDVYSHMTGRVTVVDVYQVLFNAREQYLYYRTEDGLTSLGGFYVYTELGRRMLEGIRRPSLSDYDVEYVLDGYQGNLYEHSPFNNARADILSVYRYTESPREYMVEKIGEESKIWHTLYPLHAAKIGKPMNIYLGGMEGYGITTVTGTAPYDNSLLVFGDHTALSYLPFLCDHYRTVTLVDLFQLDAEGYESLRVEDYSAALFAYSVESFMHNNYASLALRFLE